ncbi:MAG: MFS transporter, partial [Firmicutes bacterium]|nr:MFS transporter [Bacillota bacterium]
GLLISIPGGLLTDAYGPKKVSLVALAIAAAGALMVGLGGSYPLLVAGRMITGIGAGVIAVVTSQTISRWFAKKELGSAMGIYNTAMPIGTILALISSAASRRRQTGACPLSSPPVTLSLSWCCSILSIRGCLQKKYPSSGSRRFRQPHQARCGRR